MREDRVFGPPGTGKTTYLSRQVERAVEKHGEDNVMVASYTKAAAAELNQRNLPIPKESIGTLHALCYRALNRPEVAEVHIREFNEKNPAWAISGGVDMDELACDAHFGTDADRYLAEYNLYRAKMLPLNTMSTGATKFAKIWEQWKSVNNYPDFTDLINIVLTMREPPPGEPRIGIYDEAQDFNLLQMKLIRHWMQFQEYIIVAGDDDQCSIEDTMVRTTKGYIPIQNLDPSIHKLTSWYKDKSELVGTVDRISGNQKSGYGPSGMSFAMSKRRYDGHVVAVSAGKFTTRTTPEHKWPFRWSQSAKGKEVVYLMQRGKSFRIGRATLIRADGSFNFGVRCQKEGADKGWILKVCDSKKYASFWESTFAARYGIPMMLFNPADYVPFDKRQTKPIRKPARSFYDQELLDEFWSGLEVDLELRAQQLLSDCNLLYDSPFWKKNGSCQYGPKIIYTSAANLLSEIMMVATHNEGGKKDIRWVTCHVKQEPYNGFVYGLDVERHHHYIADGIITHNCLYGWSGASAEAFLNPPVPDEQKHILKQSWRLPRAVQELADHWIKQVSHREPKAFAPRDFEGSVYPLYNTHYMNPTKALEEAYRYVEQGKSVMLLASCSYMLKHLMGVLREHGTPFHNPYRKTRADWNPLGSYNASTKGRTSTRDRLVSFLNPGVEIEGKPLWEIHDLLRWAEAVKATGIFKRGMKQKIEDASDGMEFYHNRSGLLDFYNEVFEPQALDMALDRSTHWFFEHATPEKKKALAFPLKVYNTMGMKALTEKPKIIVGTIHCSPPDEPVLTTEGYVNIGNLVPGVHKLASYMSQCNRLTWNSSQNKQKTKKGYDFIVAKNPYEGPLLTITTDSSQTRITPDHRIRARFNKDFWGKWVVYLMRRGDWWRVGICVSAHMPYQSGGVLGRLATEQGDDGWILAVCKSRKEAIIQEEIIRGKYGITGLTFEAAKGRSLNAKDLHLIHEEINGFALGRIDKLFNDYGIRKDYPLYLRNAGPQRVRNGYSFEIRACNFLSGYMEMPTVSDNFTTGSSPEWSIGYVSTECYAGDVYSLDVNPHGHYISGGAVVHNSVKGGEADVVILFPDLSLSAYREMRTTEGFDSVVRMFYVGMTRAKETLVVCQPSSNLGVKLI